MARKNRMQAPRITLPKRNPSTQADGGLGGGMGNNPQSIDTTPGVIPQLAQLAAMVGVSPSGYPGAVAATIGALGSPQGIGAAAAGGATAAFTNLALQTNPSSLAKRLRKFYTDYAAPALANAVPMPGGVYDVIKQFEASDPTGIFDPKDPGSGYQYKAITENNYMSNMYAPYQQALEGARPEWMSMNDALRLQPGMSPEDIKAGMAQLGYTFVPTGGGGIFVGGGNQSSDGTTPIGASPGAGYTWSGGAWHAPQGQDPYSDIKSVRMGKKRGWVTPEVANLLRRRRQRRIQEAWETGTHPTQIRAAQEAQVGGTSTAAGLVNFRASFG